MLWQLSTTVFFYSSSFMQEPVKYNLSCILGRGKLGGNDEHMSLLLAHIACVNKMISFCCYSVIVFLLVYWNTEVKI